MLLCIYLPPSPSSCRSIGQRCCRLLTLPSSSVVSRLPPCWSTSSIIVPRLHQLGRVSAQLRGPQCLRRQPVPWPVPLLTPLPPPLWTQRTTTMNRVICRTGSSARPSPTLTLLLATTKTAPLLELPMLAAYHRVCNSGSSCRVNTIFCLLQPCVLI